MEFDATLNQLTIFLKQQQDALEELQNDLISERMKHSEISNEYQRKIDAIHLELESFNLQKGTEEINDLEIKLKDALKEKELIKIENNRKDKEIELLRKEINSKINGRFDNSEDPSDLISVIVTLEEETNRLRSEYNKNEQEKIELLKDAAQCKDEVSIINSEMVKIKKDFDILFTSHKDVEKSYKNLIQDHSKLQNKYTKQLFELKDLMGRQNFLLETNVKLNKFLSKVKMKLTDGENKVTESIRIAEESIVEKDAALLREKHALNEVGCLEKKIECLIKDRSNESEVAANRVKDDYNKSIKNLSQEIVQLETDVNEKEMEIDRRKRAQTKLENELKEKLNEIHDLEEENSKTISNLNQRIQQQQTIISRITSQRDSIEDKYDIILKRLEDSSTAMDKMVYEFQQESLQHKTEMTVVKLTYANLQRENQSLIQEVQSKNQEIINIKNHHDKILKIKCEEFENEKLILKKQIDTLKYQHSTELAQLTKDLVVLQENYQRLQALYEDEKSEYEQRHLNYQERFQDLQTNLKKSSKALLESDRKLCLSQHNVQQLEKHIFHNLQDKEEIS